MKNIPAIFITGFIISFLGTLPIGMLNITAFQISATQNMTEAMIFTLAVVLVELLVVFLTLHGANKINFESKVFHYLTPLAITLLVFLSVMNFLNAGQDSANQIDPVFMNLTQSSFLLGLLLSSLNPLHIPFWLGWNSILIKKKKLVKESGIYTSYMTGIGIGSISGFMLFILPGNFIFQNFHNYSSVLAYITGLFYLGFAGYLLFRFYKNHIKFQTP